MPSTVSSLLRSAASRRAAIQQEQNRLADMEWQLSAKTVDDYTAYVAHYNDASQTASATDRLTYTNKINSARKSFVSSEIQRKSIDVLEGRATTEDKLNTMISFYQQAAEVGDAGLAQSLNYQIDSLYKSMQSERAAQMSLATQATNAQYTTAKAYIDALKAGDASPFSDNQDLTLNNVNEMFKQLGPDGTNTLVQEISAKYGIPMASYADMALYLANNVVANTQAYRDSFDPNSEQYLKLDNELNNIQNNFQFKLAGQTLTLDELKSAAENERAGGTGPFSAQYDPEKGWSLVDNKVANWSVGPNGELVANYVAPTDTRVAGGTNQMTSAPMSVVSTKGIPYTYMTQDLGNGMTNTYAVDSQGNMYNAQGFNPEKPGKPVDNVKNYQNLEQATVKAGDVFARFAGSLQQMGLIGDNTGLKDTNGNAINYHVDENGNIQFTKQESQKNPDGSTIVAPMMYTLDSKTGQIHNALVDVRLKAQETQRLKELAALDPSRATALQGQTAASQMLMPSGASQVLQQAKDVSTIKQMKAAQIQQAATAAQISSIPAQPISVQPIPTPQPISVQPVPQAPRVSVQPLPKQPSVSVYVPPITQTTTDQKLKVVDRPTTTKVVVR